MERKAFAAGEFYPNDSIFLKDFIEEYKSDDVKKDFKAAIVPCGYYEQSGDILVKTLSSLNLPDSVIIIGLNTSGFGENISVWPEGEWQTPFGNILIDEITAKNIINASNAKSDIIGHIREYTIENIMPVLKYLKPEIKIVPISLTGMPLVQMRSFAADLSKFLLNGSSGLIISGMLARQDDEADTLNIQQGNNLLIDAVLSIDGEIFYEVVMEKGVLTQDVYTLSCGLMASYLAGAEKGEIVGVKAEAIGAVLF